MARPNRYSWSEKKIETFLRQGRGSGVGREYRPWLNVTDVPSIGVSSQPYFAKIGRCLQLLSDLESAAFLRFWWDPSVVDIREQFPLPRTETRNIASSIGVKHPRYPRTSLDVIMTTDMLVTRLNDGAIEFQAYSVKYAEDASRQRTVEKLEIERLYWERSGVRWRVISETELPAVETLNLSWIFGADETLCLLGSKGQDLMERLAGGFASAPYRRAASVCLFLDNQFGRDPGLHLAVLRAAIKRRVVSVDLSRGLVPQALCSAFEFRADRGFE
ncbi:MAG: TnsA endonuclease N-terminal domain-containing protein [Hyphomicrobiaceae bacterium]|nr:TnsA endonuclease N-terminal domain-containing protein [Hyphomicrobiaceae bacterium]